MRHFQLWMVAGVVAFRSIALAADTGGGAAAWPSAAPGNPLWAVTLDQLPVTRDRPLFSPSRRPPPRPQAPRVETVAAVPPPAARQPPSVVLLGIVTDADGTRALIRAGGADKIMPARLGDEIAGWKVSQIESRRLVLSSDDRTVSFALFAHMGGAGDPGAKKPADGAPVVRTPDTRMQTFAQERDRRGH
jgi:general secretion pathway protein N